MQRPCGRGVWCQGEEKGELSFQPASCTFLSWDTFLPVRFYLCLLEASPFFKAKLKCFLFQEAFHGMPFSHFPGGNDFSCLCSPSPCRSLLGPSFRPSCIYTWSRFHLLKRHKSSMAGAMSSPVQTWSHTVLGLNLS